MLWLEIDREHCKTTVEGQPGLTRPQEGECCERTSASPNIARARTTHMHTCATLE